MASVWGDTIVPSSGFPAEKSSFWARVQMQELTQGLSCVAQWQVHSPHFPMKLTSASSHNIYISPTLQAPGDPTPMMPGSSTLPRRSGQDLGQTVLCRSRTRSFPPPLHSKLVQNCSFNHQILVCLGLDKICYPHADDSLRHPTYYKGLLVSGREQLGLV